MMTINAMPATVHNDAQLVIASLEGDRDAFGQIVSRYQSLICSLAYSATGSLGQSEDLAQETFITAWRHLGRLRERDKLRAWLCGIARNRINNFLRREGREPIREAEPLENVAESHAPGPLPVEQTISNEEAAILWRALERIPEIYREPLVLFYREHQSVETVAANLELSEDAVKQRLSRGRKMLQEQVLAFVQTALERTNPGRVFTVAVIASLPGLTLSAKAAAAGVAAKGATAAKTAGMLGWLGLLLGPLVVVLPNYLGYRLALAGARSAEERAGIKWFFGRVALITLGLFVPLVAVVLWFSHNRADHSYLSGLLATGLVLIFLPTMFLMTWAAGPKTHAYYLGRLAREHGGVFPPAAWEYRSQACVLGLPLVHIRIGDPFAILKPPVRGWIAMGSRAVGGLFAFGGLAIAPVSVGGIALGGVALGGVAVGGLTIGGAAFGVWALFGGLAIGWKAVGCIAVAWRAAGGNIALAHDFATGGFARAMLAPDQVVQQSGQPLPLGEADWCFQLAQFVNHHWLWLCLFWLVPFLIQSLVARRAKRQ